MPVPATSRLKHFAWYHLPAIVYAMLIVFLSSIPYLHGPGLEATGVDKVIHFTEYGIFAVLISRSASQLPAFRTVKYTFVVLFPFLVLFAMGDEYLQSFIPGRDSSWGDVVADVAGAVTGLFLISRLMHRN